jgi:ribosomal protein L37E
MAEKKINVIIDCPLCEKKSLHVMKQSGGLMQCLYCGFASTKKFSGNKNNNKEFKKLPEQMQEMAVEKDNRIWIPTVMTLPIGVINPIIVEGEMFWAFAPMEKVPEERKEEFLNDKGEYYENYYDTDKTVLYKNFYDVLIDINEEEKRKKLLENSPEGEPFDPDSLALKIAEEFEKNNDAT